VSDKQICETPPWACKRSTERQRVVGKNLNITLPASAEDGFINLLDDPIRAFLYYDPDQETKNQNEDTN